VLRLARALGMVSLGKDSDFYGLALTLGDGEVRPYELAQAFSVFANQGVKRSVRFLQSATAPEEVRVLAPETAYVITHMLADNSARLRSFGSESALNIPHVASKTGTSRNFRDNWTVGYSTRYTVVVWVGNSDSSAMLNVSGVEGAGPIFRDVMNYIHRSHPAGLFPKPAGMVEQEICLPSGLLPEPYCPERRKEVFAAGTEPREKDTLWRLEGGKPTLTVPPELVSWAKARGYPLAASSQGRNVLQIETPSDLDEYRINPEVPIDRQRITFRALHSSDVLKMDWFVNDKLIGSGAEVSWVLQPGNFTIRVQSGRLQDQVSILVQ